MTFLFHSQLSLIPSNLLKSKFKSLKLHRFGLGLKYLLYLYIKKKKNLVLQYSIHYLPQT